VNGFTQKRDFIRDVIAAEKERAARAIRVDEAGFLPAALEIIERPVSPTARLTSYVLLTGLGLTVAWLAIGKLDMVASAPGKLIPIANVKLIQPAQPGLVHAIFVGDNQHVRKGQPLVELDPTISSAEAAQARKALQTAELDGARARAILGALDHGFFSFTAPAGTPSQIATMQADLARAELATIRATLAQAGADRQTAIAGRAEATTQAAKLAETLPLLDVQIDAYQRLLAKGYVSKLRVIELQRQRLAAGKDREIAISTIHKSDAQIRSATGNATKTASEARMGVLAGLAKADAEAELRREELTKALQKSGLQRLLSPVNGTITQLAVHTIGGVVEAAKPIMAVVPDGSLLVAEVAVLNRDIGLVRPGQAVSLKLAAFPFTRYGTVDGRIESVSSDAVNDETLGLVYVARISVRRTILRRDGGIMRLTPGMEVVADIRTGRRNIMSYLLSPLDEMRQDAGREP